jgi:hypothetical protein
MLAQCIKHQHQHAIPLSTMVIRAKVKNMFDNQNAVQPELKLQSFAAIAWWFECFIPT